MLKSEIKRFKDDANKCLEKDWEFFRNEMITMINKESNESNKYLIMDLYYTHEYLHTVNTMIKRAKNLLAIGYEDFTNRAIELLTKYEKINEEIKSYPITIKETKITDLDKYFIELKKRENKQFDWNKFSKNLSKIKNFGIDIINDELILHGINHGKKTIEVGIKIGDGNRVHFAKVYIGENSKTKEKEVHVSRNDRFWFSKFIFIIDLWENIPEHLKAYQEIENI